MPNGMPPPGLETETDEALNRIDRPSLERALELQAARRGAAAGAGTLAQEAPDPERLAVRWSWLQERHPEWDGKFWAECRALYAGGKRLLGDKEVMDRLFPSNLYEPPDVYKLRRDRAHYFPYAGTIIDNLLAGLGTAPMRLAFGDQDGETGSFEGDEWWDRFCADVTREGEAPGEDDDGERNEEDDGGCTMHSFLVDTLREALQTGVAWVLCDMPRAKDGEDQPKPEPYLCSVPAEQVIDWEEDDDGDLEWVLTLQTRMKRAGLGAKRGAVTHTYTLWTAADWVRYVVDIVPGHPLSPDAQIQPADSGDHDFGRVPFERLCLPEGLFGMGKLWSLAREHFNKRCATSWAEYKGLAPILYEFQGPEDKGALPVANAQTDPERGVNQLRGQGYSQLRGADDRAEWVGPDPASFKEAREGCNDTMREMHRVMFSMALSANMDSKALNRSGDSKEQDNATTVVLLEAFGRILRRFVRKILSLVAVVRAGDPVPPVQVQGLDDFDVQGVSSAIAQAVELLNGVPILSPTFKRLFLSGLYLKVLGDAVTEEQAKDIRDDTDEGCSAEQALIEGGMVMGTAGPLDPRTGKPPELADPDDDDDRRRDPDDDEPPAKAGAKAKPGAVTRKRMIGKL